MNKLIVFLALVLFVAGCENMTNDVVENGNKISVLYKGTLADGSIFDQNTEDKPLEFTVGAGNVIKGFDDAVIGMKLGESKTFTIPMKNAYGERNESLKAEIPKAQLPPEISANVTAGQKLVVQTSRGMMQVDVLAVGKDNITLDLNHPMAGKDLTFEIKILKIN